MQAVTAPAHALSAVAVASYKKLLLVSALLPSAPASEAAANLDPTTAMVGGASASSSLGATRDK